MYMVRAHLCLHDLYTFPFTQLPQYSPYCFSFLFSPLYYLMPASEGSGSSNVASYWRIRTGIGQTDTALTTEVNLALALESYGAEVDFETVWDQGHTQAERSGKGTENFIDWVNSLWTE